MWNPDSCPLTCPELLLRPTANSSTSIRTRAPIVSRDVLPLQHATAALESLWKLGPNLINPATIPRIESSVPIIGTRALRCTSKNLEQVLVQTVLLGLDVVAQPELKVAHVRGGQLNSNCHFGVRVVASHNEALAPFTAILVRPRPGQTIRITTLACNIVWERVSLVLRVNLTGKKKNKTIVDTPTYRIFHCFCATAPRSRHSTARDRCSWAAYQTHIATLMLDWVAQSVGRVHLSVWSAAAR